MKEGLDFISLIEHALCPELPLKSANKCVYGAPLVVVQRFRRSFRDGGSNDSFQLDLDAIGPRFALLLEAAYFFTVASVGSSLAMMSLANRSLNPHRKAATQIAASAAAGLSSPPTDTAMS